MLFINKSKRFFLYHDRGLLNSLNGFGTQITIEIVGIILAGPKLVRAAGLARDVHVYALSSLHYMWSYRTDRSGVVSDFVRFCLYSQPLLANFVRTGFVLIWFVMLFDCTHTPTYKLRLPTD